jgi:cell division protein ZapA (FtsZ GTPase activity inhibitor)
VKIPEGSDETMNGEKEDEQHLIELLDVLDNDFAHLKRDL